MAVNNSEIWDWTIYRITNPKGGVYIGKTSNFKGRMSNYKYLSGRVYTQKVLNNSLVKYGYDNHKIDIIETFKSTNEYASGKEIFWIRNYMSNLSKYRSMNGMNLTNGGEGSPGHKWSDERKKRMSEIHKGKKLSILHIEKIKQYKKDNPLVFSMFGMKHTDETKLKMSIAKKGKPSPLIGYKHSPETIEKNRLSHIGIPNNRKGTYIWTEEDKIRIGLSKIGNKNTLDIKWSDETKRKMKDAAIERSKPIIKYDLNYNFIEEYQSIREAVRRNDISKSGIKKILSGVTKNPQKFIFKYK